MGVPSADQSRDIRIGALRSAFRDKFGTEPRLFRAPGRVNLIGEHTDYNDGFVLPVAIDRDVLIAASPRRDRLVRLHSLDFGGSSEFSLDDIQTDPGQTWSNYVRGVAKYLLEQGYPIGGMDAVISGNVPIGSGLSSSAALEVASATALTSISGIAIDPIGKAVICQMAENRFVGVNCGIMDQYISSLGQRGHALLIDCRSLAYELIPIASSGVSVVVADTMVRRKLAGSEYNVRRRQCEEAVEALSAAMGRPLRALRDVSPDEFAAHEHVLPDVNRRRAAHVIGEDARTSEGTAALKSGDLVRFGQLMNGSHDSLRDLYEVSCSELDALVDASRESSGVLGARMTGAGFGGCIVALVEDSRVEEFKRQVATAYESRFGQTPRFFVCDVVDGAAEITAL